MSTHSWSIRRLHVVDDMAIDGLADVLIDCVEGGASVSFMHPLRRERALTFWRRVAQGVVAGERALLVAEDASGLCGCVQLTFDLPENQPHRADLSKMLVHRRARRQGLGAALMRAAEATARECGKTLLVLDAVTGGDAARLYERLGWVRVGDIPDYALFPEGGLCSTTMYYRNLAAATVSPLSLNPKRRMNIEGIKGCYEKTRGIFYFARMCSKIRLHAEGKLPADYHEMLGQGFDGRTCRYLEVRYEDVKAQVLSGKSDEEVLDWCLANGRRLTDEQVLIYNSFMSKRGWRDDETDDFIPEMIKQYGLKDDGSIVTDFDLIEMDEGRWHPEMWRDAWK